jgi:hypothetical protein
MIILKKLNIFLLLLIHEQPNKSYFWPYLKMPSKVIRMTNLCARRQFPGDIAKCLMEFIFHTVESVTRNRHYISMNQITTAESSVNQFVNAELAINYDPNLFMFWAADYFRSHQFQFQAYFCPKCGQYESAGLKNMHQKAFRISCRSLGDQKCRRIKYTPIMCECGDCECCKWTLNTTQ